MALRKSAILLFLSFFKLQVKNHLWLFFFFLCECNHITSSSCLILFFCVVHSDTFLQYFFLFCFVSNSLLYLSALDIVLGSVLVPSDFGKSNQRPLGGQGWNSLARLNSHGLMQSHILYSFFMPVG